MASVKNVPGLLENGVMAHALRFHYAGNRKIPLSAVLVVPRGTGALKDRERLSVWEKTSIF
jgi:hypothetical protein